VYAGHYLSATAQHIYLPVVQVWPKGKVVFPDFFLNRTSELWQNLIVNHRKIVPFDGLWIVSGCRSIVILKSLH
jgi:hypothetical protein